MKPRILLISLVGVFLLICVCVTLSPEKPHRTYKTRCRVDSVNVRLKYEVMPERVYTYYTACGNISSSQQMYNVGDSIEFTTYDYRTIEK